MQPQKERNSTICGNTDETGKTYATYKVSLTQKDKYHDVTYMQNLF